MDEEPAGTEPVSGEPSEEERPPRRRSLGAGMAIPAVLMIVTALLAVGMLRGDEEEQPSPTPVPIVPAANTFLYCSDCHADLDKSFKAGEHPTLLFTHDEHFSIGVSDCAACHSAKTHEPDKINRPTMVTCYQCHTLEEDARAPGECSLCHPADMDPEPSSHLQEDWLPTAHSEAALADPFDCATCHQQSFCNSCHGLQLPHPDGFEERAHAEAFFEDPALCDTCHPREPLVRRDDCDRCHHPQGPASSTWIEWHPEVVSARGAETCFQCHATQTCQTCHRQGPERFTNEDLAADEALLATSATASPAASPSATTTPDGAG